MVAWMGPSKCTASVSGSPYDTCPIKPHKIRFIYGTGYYVTAGKCQRCSAVFSNPLAATLQANGEETKKRELLQEKRLTDRKGRVNNGQEIQTNERDIQNEKHI